MFARLQTREDGQLYHPAFKSRQGMFRSVCTKQRIGLCQRIGCMEAHTLQCAGCHRQRYCSSACQIRAWTIDGHDGGCDATMDFRIGAELHDAETIAILTMAYTHQVGTAAHPAFYDGRAIEFLTMDPAQIVAIMMHRKNVFTAVAELHKTELTNYDDHDINHDRLKKWVNILERFEKHRDIAVQGDEVVTLEKTWPEYLTNEETEWDAAGNATAFESDDEANTRRTDMVAEMTSESALAVARGFQGALRYVGRVEFMNAARTAVRDAITNAHHNKSKVVWMNYYSANRSQSWLTLILWDEFKDAIDAVAASYTELHALASAPALADTYTNIVAIVPDDAAYSGQQLAIKAGVFAQRLGRFESSRKIHIWMAVPFVSDVAIAALTSAAAVSQHIDISVSGVSPMMRTLAQHFEEYPATRRALDKLPSHAFVHDTRKDHIPVYFAHKLADNISVPNHLIAVAPYPKIMPDGSIAIKSVSFIQGCGRTNYEFAPIDPASAHRHPANDFVQEEGKVCPFPVYKKVQLTYMRRPILHTDNIALWADEVDEA